MKKIVVAIFAILLIPAPVFAVSIDSATKLLLHADGVNGSTSFVDSSFFGHTVSSIGTPVDTSDKIFGTGSALFQGSNTGEPWNNFSGNHLSVPGSSDWNFGSENFTIDFWVNMNTVAKRFPMLSYSDGNTKWRLEWDGSDPFGHKLAFEVGRGSPYDYLLLDRSLWEPTADTWYHIAEVRDGDNWYTFVNGSLIGALVQSFAIPDIDGELMIGRIPLWAGLTYIYADGNMDEIRISKGIARWTSNFNPPDSPYSAPVPEPATLVLLGSGILGMLGYRRKK